MKAIQVSRPGSFESVEKDLPEPPAGHVRLRVKACGICHTDAAVRGGQWPGLILPRVPGHEVAAVIDALGDGVAGWQAGQRVGVGWAGQRCGICDGCRRGTFKCQKHRVTGVHYDGGYAEYMNAPVEALVPIPDGLSFEEAAPLLCAGTTTFQALRRSPARPGDVVAVQGIGGLGHLAIQFASRMGFKTVAVSSGGEKRELALKLGAHVYIDGSASNAAEQLKMLGGARVILATAPNAAAMTSLVGGLGVEGELVIAAVTNEPLTLSPMQLIPVRGAVRGWAVGASSSDSEDTLKFCALAGIRPMIEPYRLDEAERAYDRMITNRARFRAVLVNS